MIRNKIVGYICGLPFERKQKTDFPIDFCREWDKSREKTKNKWNHNMNKNKKICE